MENRPNILLITTHDSGRFFGCYGIPTVASPAIDRLASQGVLLTHCFSAAAKCSPSRAAMMTGRWPQANGILGLTHAPHWWRLRPGERHLASLLKDLGYAPHLFHFQHEAEEPRDLGFQYLHALPAPHDPMEMPDPWAQRPAGEVAAAFAAFCRGPAAHGGPFYAQVGFFETHKPWDFGGNQGDETLGLTVPGNYAQTPAVRESFRMMQGAVRQADQAVGTMLAALDETGLARNTLVVFTTDHGLSLARAKGTLYDLGLEVAMIVRWPAGGVGGGRILSRLTSNIDLLPTLLDLIEAPIPGNLQGLGFAPQLRGTDGPERGAVFGLAHESRESRCIRTRQHKLIRNFSPVRHIEVPVDPERSPVWTVPFVELYDLEADPLETENLAGREEYKALREELDERLHVHLWELEDPVLHGPVVTPYTRQAIEDANR